MERVLEQLLKSPNMVHMDLANGSCYSLSPVIDLPAYTMPKQIKDSVDHSGTMVTLLEILNGKIHSPALQKGNMVYIGSQGI